MNWRGWFGKKKGDVAAPPPVGRFSASAAETSAASNVAPVAAPLGPRQRESPIELPALGEDLRWAPGRTEEMIAFLAEQLPFLPDLLSAPSGAERLRIVEANVRPERFGQLIQQLTIIEFHFGAKDKNLAGALALAELQLQLARRMPPDAKDLDDVIPSRTRHLADALSSVGSHLADMGATSNALEFYRDAEVQFELDQQERKARGLSPISEHDRIFGGRAAIAIFYENFGKLLQQVGDDEASVRYFKRRLQFEAAVVTPEVKFNRAISTGIAAEEENDFNAAFGAYQEALDEALSNSATFVSTRAAATACHHMGELAARTGLYRRALWYHGQARRLNESSGHLERLHYDLKALGRVYAKRPQYGDALMEFEGALKCVSAAGSLSDPFSWSTGDETYRVLNPDLAWDSAVEIGRLHRAAGRFARAESFFQLAISLSDAARSSLLSDRHRIGVQGGRAAAYNAMVSLHGYLALASTGPEQAIQSRLTFEFAERARGRAFLDSLGNSPFVPPPSVPPDLCANETELLERMRHLREREASTAVWDAFNRAQQDLQDVWESIKLHGEAAQAYVALRRGEPMSWAGLRDLLAAEAGTTPVTMIALFDTGDEFYMMTAGAADLFPRISELPIDRQSLSAAMLQHLRPGTAPSVTEVEIAAIQQPLQSLLDGILQAAPRSDLLWIVPHSILHRVPLHAFDVNGEPLVERNPICYSPSASVIQYCRANRRPSSHRALLLADSRGDMPLPHAREQVLSIRPLLPDTTETLIGAAATRAHVEEALASAPSFDVVHLACHGIFSPEDPLSSGILLAPDTAGTEAVWTARELLASRIPVNLMTLSACESGLNEALPGEELLGLTRAVLHAGAASVAVSGWSVDEISTSILMCRFYQAIAGGADKAEALRSASLSLRCMSAAQALSWCEQGRLRPDADPAERDLLEEDIASFRFQACDFKGALSAYAELRARCDPETAPYRRLTVRMSQCRLALRNEAAIDYGVKPFRDPYYWASFTLVGSWA